MTDFSVRIHDDMQDIWRERAARAAALFGTPHFLVAESDLWSALSDLQQLSVVSVRHWLSVKTMPCRRLLTAWAERGGSAEVVSPFELQACLSSGFPPDRILVNGVAKHSWLFDCNLAGLRVHLDSTTEASRLLPIARDNRWRVGLRFHATNEVDPDEPSFPTQFGMIAPELKMACDLASHYKVDIEGLHFHLRSNVRSAQEYEDALNELAAISPMLGITPCYIDCGGGFPVLGERSVNGSPFNLEFSETEVGLVLDRISRLIPSVREIWLENGRRILSGAGALVLRVLDVKERGACRYLICDGGRTNHALVSDWERHDIIAVPRRTGSQCPTTICGPTCMAFDHLARVGLPEDTREGDLIVWMNAGAYHVPWETRFSFGYATVLWLEESGKISIARSKETFESWWGQWSQAQGSSP